MCQLYEGKRETVGVVERLHTIFTRMYIHTVQAYTTDKHTCVWSLHSCMHSYPSFAVAKGGGRPGPGSSIRVCMYIQYTAQVHASTYLAALAACLSTVRVEIACLHTYLAQYRFQLHSHFPPPWYYRSGGYSRSAWLQEEVSDLCWTVRRHDRQSVRQSVRQADKTDREIFGWFCCSFFVPSFFCSFSPPPLLLCFYLCFSVCLCVIYYASFMLPGRAMFGSYWRRPIFPPSLSFVWFFPRLAGLWHVHTYVGTFLTGPVRVGESVVAWAGEMGIALFAHSSARRVG